MPLEQADFDIPEIQSLDAEEIIRHKLTAAMQYAQSEYIVEDTSLYLDCLGGSLPCHLIKWFEKSFVNEGIVELARRFDNYGAVARTYIGYSAINGIKIFSGELRGTIISPRGNLDFGWGPIFVPNGGEKTFGEMTREEKHKISMWRLALDQLRDFLEV